MRKDKVNYKLCSDIVSVWNKELVVNHLTPTEGIKVLMRTFKGQHMTVADVSYLYSVTPDTRYFECGVSTHIKVR